VTVVGPGGIGKTRLALAAAAAVREDFADGLVFVDLSDISDPSRVVGAIAQAVGPLEVGPDSPIERLADVVADRSLLLVLDNAEHVLAASADLARLLDATDRLRLLVTSRCPLRLRWEHVFEVPPLELPDLACLPALPQLGRMTAVAMFLDRARAAGADVHLDEPNAPVVAELCVRLDGVPLALELAATQTRRMSPEALLARMEHRLDLLAGGFQDQPIRHRTLRAALAWSYELLTDEQRIVFRRLGVFVGGISPDAAQAVVSTGSAEPDLLARLGELVDHNLLRRELLPGGEPRFRMLETVRELAREKLALAGELDDAEQAFAEFWDRLAERADAELRGPGQLAWLDRLERERPNLDAALAWCDRAGRGELGVRLVVNLAWFWYLRGGDRSEARSWSERFAGLVASLPSVRGTRARALSAAGLFAQYQMDLPAALALQEEALALGEEIRNRAVVALVLGRLAHIYLFRVDFARGAALAAAAFEESHHLGDRWGMAFALGTRGLIARSEGRLDEATQFLVESLGLFRQHGDRWGVAHVLLGLGQVALHRGDAGLAEEYWSERLQLSRELANLTAVAHTLDLLAAVACRRGEHARASARYEEALAIRRRSGDRRATAWVLQGMGELALERGDRALACAYLRECLLLRRDVGDEAGVVASLVAFARLAAVARRPRRALRLAGAAEALYRAMGPALAVQHYSHGVIPTELAADPDVARARRLLGATQRTAAWEEGEALALDQVIAEALALEHELTAPAESTAPQPIVPPAGPGPALADLTRREREVAALLARGYTNRQIAADLVVTEGSAHLHVVRLLGKLGFHTRAQIAGWAVAQGATPPAAS
jgi:predicted ATPase/DNA-binding CsgD family transcriptional regulator